MSNPSTRQELADYCLRSLGAPVIEINLDEDQIEDRIDEALQFYQEFHGDATLRNYGKHQITNTDITNEYITLPDNWIFVNRVFPFSGISSGQNMFSYKYQIMLNDIYDMTKGDAGVLSYEMSMQYLNSIDMILNGTPTIRWQRHANRLYIDTTWGEKLLEGDWIVVEGRTTIDPEDHSKIYNDLWLKRYLTALMKRNWGDNLKKFEGIQMPGGVTLNGQKIFDESLIEIDKLEQEMYSRFELPVDMQVG